MKSVTCLKHIRVRNQITKSSRTIFLNPSVVHNGARGPKWALWGFSLGSFKIIFW